MKPNHHASVTLSDLLFLSGITVCSESENLIQYFSFKVCKTNYNDP